MLTIAALSLTFGMLFTTLSTAQPVFDRSFGQGPSFPYWFGIISLLSGSAGFLNASIVVRFGMRRVITAALAAEAVLSAIFILVAMSGVVTGTAAFGVYVAWVFTIFFTAGLTIGNLNALGMEPLGHLAGLAASIIGSLSTIAAVFIAIPVGLAFDGTPLPHAIGVCVAAVLGVAVMWAMGPGDPVNAD